MKEQELRKYFDLYTACWKLFRKYSDPDSSDEFWEGLYEEANAIVDSCDKQNLAREMVLATFNEIESIYKRK